MKKRFITLLLLLLPLLSACTPAKELDAYGYAVMLGLDTAKEGAYAVSFLFQNIGSENIESGGKMQLCTVEAGDLPDAVVKAEAALPFSVNLSRLSCIVASKAAAEEGVLRAVLLQQPELLGVREYVNLLVAEDAGAYLEAVQNEIVPSITKLQAAQLEYEENTGLSANVTLADYRETIHSRTDCAAPYSRRSGAEGALDYELSGCVLFSDGHMTGMLSKTQAQLLQMATGAFVRGRRSVQGHVDAALELRQYGKPHVALTLGESPHAAFTLCFRAARRQQADRGTEIIIAREMEAELLRLFDYCKAANSDAFRLSPKAAAQFTRAADWEAYNWDACYRAMTASFSVQIRLLEEERAG